MCVCSCVFICPCVLTCVRVLVCVYNCLRACVCLCLCPCVPLCVRACVCVRAYACVRAHVRCEWRKGLLLCPSDGFSISYVKSRWRRLAARHGLQRCSLGPLTSSWGGTVRAEGGFGKRSAEHGAEWSGARCHVMRVHGNRVCGGGCCGLFWTGEKGGRGT